MLTVDGDSVFTQNQAIGNGGAIHLSDFTPEEEGATTASTSFTLNGASFTLNSADRGGAIYSIRTTYSIANGVFISNQAINENYGGGAIYGTESNITVASTVLNENTSHKGGAVALHTKSTMTVTSLIANGNTATVNPSSSLGVGGVFFVNNSSLSLNGDTASSIVIGKDSPNTAINGGAIHLENSATLNITSATITGNLANTNGGAIYSTKSTVNISGDDTLINYNEATGHGGAIYLVYTTVDGDKVGSTLNMTGGTIHSNKASSGGGISGRTNSVINIFGSTLSENQSTATTTGSTDGGGAIYTNNSALTISNSTLTGNTAGYYGGALRAVDCPSVIINQNTVISDNTGTTGGAICLHTPVSFGLLDITLTSNEARGSGVIYANGGTGRIESLVATDNTAKNGGVLYLSGGTHTANNLTASQNSATSGGVAYIGSGAKLTLENSALSKNSATNGGAIYSTGSATLTVTEGSLTENTASANGGAIYHGSSTTASLSLVTLNKNTANNSGGAIYAIGSGELLITDCTFDQNKSLSTVVASEQIGRGGGAIFVSQTATVTVSDGAFTSNQTNGTVYTDAQTDGGGAIMVDGGILKVSGAEFTLNTAKQGGAIGTSKSNLTAMDISGCTFTKNSASGNGGAIFIQNYVKNETDSIIVSDCSFIDNTATSSGGMIYVRTDGSATIKNITGSGNGDWTKGSIYATTRARITLLGSVSLSGDDNVYVTGSGTTAIVKHSTEEEKTAWADVIKTANSGIVTYTDISSEV